MRTREKIVVLALMASFFMPVAIAQQWSLYVHRGSVKEFQHESDNWLMLLVGNHQVTFWGDGPLNGSALVSHGVAVINQQNPRRLTANDFVAVHRARDKRECRIRYTPIPNAITGGELCVKVYGATSLESGIWAWLIDDFPSEGKGFRNFTLVQSIDGGRTWHKGMVIPESNGMMSPVFLQTGPVKQDPRWTYLFWSLLDPRNSGFSIHGAQGRKGHIFLTRVLHERINRPQAYQVWSGNGWTAANISVKGWQAKGVPAFSDRDGIGWTYSVAHLPQIDKYMLISEHTKHFAGHIGFHMADNPWGPWRTVTKKFDMSLCFPKVHKGRVFGYTGMGKRFFYVNVSNKWSYDHQNSSKYSGDGYSFWMVGTGIDGDDSFNLFRVTLKPASEYTGPKVGRQRTCGELVSN